MCVKIITRARKYYSWNSSTCICENGKYLKSIVDNSKVVYDQSIYVIYIVPTNVTSTVSIHSVDKKARYKFDCHVLSAIICYHYAKVVRVIISMT